MNNKIYLIYFFCLGFSISIVAQNLSCSRSVTLLPNLTTDKGLSMCYYQSTYLIAWKETGVKGKIHIGQFKSDKDKILDISDKESFNSTSFAPHLSVFNNNLYLFWIDDRGNINYQVGSPTGLFNSKIQVLGTESYKSIHTLVLGNTLLLTASTANNKLALFSLHTEGGGTELKITHSQIYSFPKVKINNPQLAILSNTHLRVLWRNDKNAKLGYADYNIEKKSFDKAILFSRYLKSNTAASFSSLQNGSFPFCLWTGYKKDKRIFYSDIKNVRAVNNSHVLPSFLTTEHEVALCGANNNTAALAFVNLDGKIHVSRVYSYNPASWMKDILMPSKSDFTLKDIVIPGSHDAGMSVLNGVGGTQSFTINDCNTLTQVKNIHQQLAAGIRMFDLRIGRYDNAMHLKHASSDCVADAIGGGFGEKLKDVLEGVKSFLDSNNQEVVILAFSHFCDREVPMVELADTIIQTIGENKIFRNKTKTPLHELKLKNLAGKVIIIFEDSFQKDDFIIQNTMAKESSAFLNFKREYAATNKLPKLFLKEETFFKNLETTVKPNDLIKLDWQLTQGADEAGIVCNDFETEAVNPIVSGIMLAVKKAKKYKSIINLALFGNQHLTTKINEWIDNKTITQRSKPNILYVDIATEWITDYCVNLNMNEGVYQK